MTSRAPLYGVFVPTKTPPETIARLNGAIVAAVRTPLVQERLLAFGCSRPAPGR